MLGETSLAYQCRPTGASPYVYARIPAVSPTKGISGNFPVAHLFPVAALLTDRILSMGFNTARSLFTVLPVPLFLPSAGDQTVDEIIAKNIQARGAIEK